MHLLPRLDDEPRQVWVFFWYGYRFNFLEPFQAVVYNFTMHWANGRLADKLGSCLLLRRSSEGQSVLLSLLSTHKILQLSASSLTEFLKHNGTSLKALSTKTAKIRALMRLPFMSERLSDHCKEALEKKLQEMDKKQKAKPATEHPASDDEDDHQARHQSESCELATTWF